MRRRSAELIATAVLCCLATASPAQQARLIGEFVWQSDADGHGGYSGLEVSDDGAEFTTITDSADLIQGRFVRSDGVITGIAETARGPLLGESGAPLEKNARDAEGLAIAPDGEVFVSFELVHRVVRYSGPGAAARALPQPREFLGFGKNSSLEALAIDAAGVLYTLPERSGRMRRPFPVFAYADGTWSMPFTLPRRGAFLVVGADFGPDGRLYVLEREVRSPFGLATRVRSFDISGGDATDEREHLETAPGVHQNLEGLAVWRDGSGSIRLTMIADNNFMRFVRTFIVEYVLDE